jgi:hypothetical protein
MFARLCTARLHLHGNNRLGNDRPHPGPSYNVVLGISSILSSHRSSRGIWLYNVLLEYIAILSSQHRRSVNPPFGIRGNLRRARGSLLARFLRLHGAGWSVALCIDHWTALCGALLVWLVLLSLPTSYLVCVLFTISILSAFDSTSIVGSNARQDTILGPSAAR